MEPPLAVTFDRGAKTNSQVYLGGVFGGLCLCILSLFDDRQHLRRCCRSFHECGLSGGHVFGTRCRFAEGLPIVGRVRAGQLGMLPARYVFAALHRGGQSGVRGERAPHRGMRCRLLRAYALRLCSVGVMRPWSMHGPVQR